MINWNTNIWIKEERTREGKRERATDRVNERKLSHREQKKKVIEWEKQLHRGWQRDRDRQTDRKNKRDFTL